MNVIHEYYQTLDSTLSDLLFDHQVEVSDYPNANEFMQSYIQRINELCEAIGTLDTIFKKITNEQSLKSLMSRVIFIIYYFNGKG